MAIKLLNQRKKHQLESTTRKAEKELTDPLKEVVIEEALRDIMMKSHAKIRAEEKAQEELVQVIEEVLVHNSMREEEVLEEAVWQEMIWM